MSTYLPKLFIRNIGNATSSQIYRVIEDLGFGIVTRINFKGHNAIAYVNWDIPNTRATRIILEEGARPLLLYHSDNRFWKVTAYKSYEEREEERMKRTPVASAPNAPPTTWAEWKIQESKRVEEAERLERIRLKEELIKQEQAKIDKMLEEERMAAAYQQESDEDYENYFDKIPENLVTSLDYGNATENYPVVRRNIRARIRLG